MIRADAYTPDVWEAICTPMHEILPASPKHGSGALFLGSWTAAVDTDLLARHGVRAIVECHDAPWGICESTSSANGSGVAIPDSPTPGLLEPHLDGAVRFIRDRLSRGENVLVHCQQGISRSPAIVCAFLMRERALSYDAALQIVRSRRKCIKPNVGFENTLRSWK
ncbi:phosphatases II [Fomitiporia mediterranea MF3/22]|uniref:phosphatases II n=1 Tax=Fomitiporia mediterranea (strain MF3/22) TaxID=694068 RepID=UPI0004407E06|nr:phosphatases II [Fomitiporia mediterranea MF3/22]EJC98349.1 phosphatases II [Fomitiporia mediterranea MF3/22]